MRFTKYLALIGVVLFLFILYSVGPLEIAANLLKLNPFLFSVVLVLLLPVLLLKGWKQSILLDGLGKRISVAESTRIWLIGFFFGTVTPAKAGDFFRAIYLEKSVGLPVGAGIAVAAAERIIDLAYLFVAGLLGLILFSVHFSLDFSVVIALSSFLVLFIAAVFVLTRKRWVSFLLRPLFNFFLPEKFKQRLRGSFHDFYAGAGRLSSAKRVLALAVLLTVVSWVLLVFQYYLLALSLGLAVSFEFLFWVMPAILLIEVLPISFAGIGTRDAVTVFFLSFALISASGAVSFSLAILFLNIFTAMIGLFFLNRFELRKGAGWLG